MGSVASLIEFGLLGPLEATADGEPLALGAAKQRALLAVLLLNANEFVSHDRLIDALWGESASDGASHSLQVYVSALRKVLAAHGARELLVTSPGGYLVRLDPGQLDLVRFQALVEEGRLALAAGASALGAAKLREALALWRGEPLADLQFERFARTAIERLDELRTAAVEDRIDADLQAGLARELVPELSALIGRHPLRERLRRQLMLALYRAGRQADALQVYRETRRLLIDELGIEPGPELKQLEQAILSHDPALDVSASSQAAPAPVQVAASRERPRMRRPLFVSALVPVLVGVGVTLFFLLHDAPVGLAHIDPNAVGVVDPSSGRIVAEVRAGSTPTAATFGAGSLWVASTNSNSVLRIDSKTTAPRDTIEVGHGPSGIAFGYGAAWVANSLDGTLSRIDAGTGGVVQTIPVGSNPSAVAIGLGAVWVANTDDRTVMRLDRGTGKVMLISHVGIRARSIAVGGGGVWITNDAGANVLRLDETGGETDKVGVGNGPAALAFGAGSLWVANDIDGTVSRIDPASRRVRATIAVGNGAGGLTFARDHLWVTSEFGGMLVQVDPELNRVVRKLPVAERPTAVVEGDGRLWVMAGASGSAHRGGTLRVSETTSFDSFDPALAYTPASWSLLIMTNDGLTGFKRVGGAEGGRLVPDLATELPAPTEGGRAYTFQLRPDVRYSTGALVRPEDFRRALERVFALGSPGSGYYANIVGAKSCQKRPESCDLSQGIDVDAASNTVTFHLFAPDPEFLYKLALPFAYAVPAETPVRASTRPLPATGPYAVAAYTGTSLQLERNSHFREWSRAAQPDGYPDEIVVSYHEDASDAEVTRVLHGETDLLKGNVPADRLEDLATRYPGRLHRNRLHQTIYVFLNTRVRPFDDVRVRRAVNYALDRADFAELIGGRLAEPVCHIVPPTFAGYVPYCPYTARPSPDGRWSEPDLDEARRLVAASGTKGERIVVWIQPGLAKAGAEYLAGLLRSLGYKASLEFVSSSTYLYAVSDPKTKVQMGGLNAWHADLPLASAFVEPTFGCAPVVPTSPLSRNLAKFCDRTIDAKMDRAKVVEATDPLGGDWMWARIERELVDRAPWLPVATGLEPNLVSARVGNYQYSPQWRVLVAQLWVQ